MRPFDPRPIGRKLHPTEGYQTLPEVEYVSPNYDRVGGGASVTVYGARFVDGATVSFGGTLATNVVFVSQGEITCDAPAHAEGAVTVVVTNPSGETGELEEGFSFIAGHITSLSLSRGTVLGGTPLTITGVNFVAGSTIEFGDELATSVVFVDDQHYRCVTPAHGVGLVDIVITEPSATQVVGKKLFSYTSQIFGGDIRRNPSITIEEGTNARPSTARYNIDGSGSPPIVGERITFAESGVVLFDGQVIGYTMTVEDAKENVVWSTENIDHSFRFNKKRPFGLYNNQRANEVAKDLIDKYAPGFNTTYIQARLPHISLVLDGAEDMLTVFAKIAQLIGDGHFYLDATRGVHLYKKSTQSLAPGNSPLSYGAAAMIVQEGSVSTLGHAFRPGYWYFFTSFRYGTAKTYTTPHGSIPIPPSPGYAQLSDEAADINLTGTISNGAYGLGLSRGWVDYDGSGNLIPEGWGGHIPRVAGDVQFATADVLAVLEAAAGGGTFETGLSAMTDVIFLDDWLPRFTSIPTGPVIGGRACTARIIYAIRLGDCSTVGGTPLVHYATIEDNVTVDATPVPAISSSRLPARSVTYPVPPKSRMRALESTIAVDPTEWLGREAQAGYWAFRVTGVYKDGTESRGCTQTAPVEFSGAYEAMLQQIPVFPNMGSIPCVFRKVYASIFEPYDPVQFGVPSFEDGTTRCVALIPNNVDTEATFPFGGGICGGERSKTNLPPGIEDELGPDLEAVVVPDPIDGSNVTLLAQPPLSLDTDISQLRNRILLRGKGSILTADAPVGSTLITVTDVSPFSPTGGLLAIGHRIFAYKGLSGTSGRAAIYLSNPLDTPILQADWKFGGGTPVRTFAQVDDLESQAHFGAIEVDEAGNPTDGVHEYTIYDDNLSTQAQLIARGQAELVFAWPQRTLSFSTRDPKVRKGRTVAVDLDDPPIHGDFVIQEVRIDQYHDESDELAPRYNVVAYSGARFNFNDLLRYLDDRSTKEKAYAGLFDTVRAEVTVNIPDTARPYLFIMSQTGVYATRDGITNYMPSPLAAINDLRNSQRHAMGPEGYAYFAQTAGVLRYFDGTTYKTRSELTPPTNITHLLLGFDSKLYIACNSPDNVYTWNGEVMEALTDSAALGGSGGAGTYAGKIAMLADGTLFTYTNNGYILRRGKREDGTYEPTWSRDYDFVFTANFSPTNFLAVGNDIYMTMRGTNAASAGKLFYKRTSNGVWSNITPSAFATTQGYFRAPAVHDDELYICYHDAAFTRVEIWKQSKATGTWALDFDSIADNPTSLFAWFSDMYSFGGYLFAVTDDAGDSYVMRKSGGTWAHYPLVGGGWGFSFAALQPQGIYP